MLKSPPENKPQNVGCNIYKTFEKNVIYVKKILYSHNGNTRLRSDNGVMETRSSESLVGFDSRLSNSSLELFDSRVTNKRYQIKS